MLRSPLLPTLRRDLMSRDRPPWQSAQKGGDTLKKAYARPDLVEYGRAQQLTLGTTGSQPDYVIIGGVLTPNPNNPNCVNNGSPYLSCVPTP